MLHTIRLLKLSTAFTSVNIIGIYAKSDTHNQNQHHHEFLRELAELLHPYRKHPTIILGYINMYSRNAASTSSLPLSQTYKRFLSTYKLIDVWPHMFPNTPGFTYYHAQGSSRIDVILDSQHLVSHIKGTELHKLAWYDHNLIWAIIELTYVIFLKKSSYTWRFNNTHLQQEEIWHTKIMC